MAAKEGEEYALGVMRRMDKQLPTERRRCVRVLHVHVLCDSMGMTPRTVPARPLFARCCKGWNCDMATFRVRSQKTSGVRGGIFEDRKNNIKSRTWRID